MNHLEKQRETRDVPER